MKRMSFFSMVLTFGYALLGCSSAFAQGNFYRIYDGFFLIGDVKVPIHFRVNDAIVENRFGEPEIPGHGFIEKSISLSMVEGRLSCAGSLSLENGEMKSCSGLRMKIASPGDLLSEKQVRGKIYLPSSDVAIGSVDLSLKFTEAGDHYDNFDE